MQKNYDSRDKNPSSSPKINNSFKKKLVLLGSFRKNSFSFRETEGSFEKNLSLKGSSQKNPSSFSKIKNSFQKKLVLAGSFRKNSFSFCKTESCFEKNISLKESSRKNRSVHPKNEYSSGQDIIFQTILIKESPFFPQD